MFFSNLKINTHNHNHHRQSSWTDGSRILKKRIFFDILLISGSKISCKFLFSISKEKKSFRENVEHSNVDYHQHRIMSIEQKKKQKQQTKIILSYQPTIAVTHRFKCR